jgi:hypothetical protein
MTSCSPVGSCPFTGSASVYSYGCSPSPVIGSTFRNLPTVGS